MRIFIKSPSRIFESILFASLTMIWGLALFLLTLHPSEPSQPRVWIYSYPRWGEILFALAATGLSFFTFSSSALRSKVRMHVHNTRGGEALFFSGVIAAFFAFSSYALLKAVGHNESLYRFSEYARQLSPILKGVFFTGIEGALWALFLHQSTLASRWHERKDTFPIISKIWAVSALLTFAVWYARNHLREHFHTYLGGPMTPLLEWQILLALGIAFFLMHRSPTSISAHWAALAIWGATAAFWLLIPIHPGYSATPPQAPNFEIYPFSDAQLYAENAQTILTGKGMSREEFPARPLYVVFLAIINALGKQNYLHAIALQTILLALFPALFYLLGRRFYGHPAGVALALLAALRDVTTNQVAPFVVTVTYSKVFLSELPVALLLLLFILLWIKAMQDPRTAVLAGGVLGLAVLIRTQSIAATLPALALLFLPPEKQWKERVRGILLLTIGLFLALSPWLWRNWQHTGGIVIDNPLSQMNVFASRYAGYEEGHIIPHLPNENDSEYSSRMLSIAIENIRAHPGNIAIAVTGHFLQNELDSLLVFPIRASVDGFQDFYAPARNFWETWDSSISFGKILVLGIYLFLFSTGIAFAWKKERWLGIFPLGVHLIYNVWTALFLTSGMRFVFPVDWIFLFYETLGLLAGIHFFLSIFRETSFSTNIFFSSPRWMSNTALLLIFTLGASIPLSEHIVPDHYPPRPQAEIREELSRALLSLNTKDATFFRKEILSSDDLYFAEGRVIYPRYFKAGEGLPMTAKPGYRPEGNARIVFYLAGQKNGRVILPLDESPSFFPHAADALVVFRGEDLSNPVGILIQKDGIRALYLAESKKYSFNLSLVARFTLWYKKFTLLCP